MSEVQLIQDEPGGLEFLVMARHAVLLDEGGGLRRADHRPSGGCRRSRGGKVLAARLEGTHDDEHCYTSKRNGPTRPSHTQLRTFGNLRFAKRDDVTMGG